MGDNSQLLYNHGTIHGAAGDIDKFVRVMHDKLEGVDSDFNRLRSSWDSDSARQFDDCRKRWEDGAREIADHLLRLKMALIGASERMSDADKRAKQLFPG